MYNGLQFDRPQHGNHLITLWGVIISQLGISITSLDGSFKYIPRYPSLSLKYQLFIISPGLEITMSMRDKIYQQLDTVEMALFDILQNSKIRNKTTEQSMLDGLVINSRCQSIIKSTETLMAMNAQMKKALLLNDLREIKKVVQ